MTTPTTPGQERAERVGECIGTAYHRTIALVAEPIRRAPAPNWHRRAAYRTGRAARTAAVAGAEHAERRLRTAPRRIVRGLRRLLARRKTTTVKARAARWLVPLGAVWWGWQWADRAGMPLWHWAAPAAAVLAAVGYAAGSEPDKAPVTLVQRARARRAAALLLGAIDLLVAQYGALHLADLADQITARSCGRAWTAARLRTLLDTLGVPVREQIVIGSTVGPGIHPDDWRAWAARHRPRGAADDGRQEQPSKAAPEPPPAAPEPAAAAPEPVTTPLPHPVSAPLPRAETTPTTPPKTETPQVRRGDRDISARDLGARPTQPPMPAAAPDDERQRLLAHTRTAIGTERGAHLRDILAVAQAAGDCEGWSVGQLRRALEDAGVPVKEKLWLRGGNTRGVLASALPAPADTEEMAS